MKLRERLALAGDREPTGATSRNERDSGRYRVRTPRKRFET
jgi:hypothetical protein